MTRTLVLEIEVLFRFLIPDLKLAKRRISRWCIAGADPAREYIIQEKLHFSLRQEFDEMRESVIFRHTTSTGEKKIYPLDIIALLPDMAVQDFDKTMSEI